MYVFPELDTLNVDENERRHIEDVISKAEQRDSPFVIKLSTEEKKYTLPENCACESDKLKRPVPEVSIQSPIRNEVEFDRFHDIYPTRRVLERIDSQSEVSSEQPLSPKSDITLNGSNNSNIHLFETHVPTISNHDRRNSLSPSLLFGNLSSAVSPLVSPSSFFQGNRRLSAPVAYGNIYSPLSSDKAEHIFEVDEEALINEGELLEENIQLAESMSSPSKENGIKAEITEDDGLTYEELEHIKNINEMAKQALGNTYEMPHQTFIPAEVSQKPDKKTRMFGSGLNFNFTKVKNAMETVNSATNAVYSALENTRKSSTSGNDPVHVATKEDNVDESITYNDHKQPEYSPKLTNVEGTELSLEELEHISRIAALAEQESQVSTLSNKPKRDPDFGLTQAEMDHIERITKLAEQEIQGISVSEEQIPSVETRGIAYLSSETEIDDIQVNPEQSVIFVPPQTTTENTSIQHVSGVDDDAHVTLTHETINPETLLISSLQGNVNEEESRKTAPTTKNIYKTDINGDLQKSRIKIIDTASKFSTFGFGSLKKAKMMLAKTAEQVSETIQQNLPSDTLSENRIRSSVDTQSKSRESSGDEVEIMGDVGSKNFTELEPSSPEFWATDVETHANDYVQSNRSIDSSLSLEKTDPSQGISDSVSRNLASTLSDYDMADENPENVRTIQWYEQQLTQMNRSLDEDFGMFKNLFIINLSNVCLF